MPLYEFECCYCSLQFKRNLAMDEHATHPCPNCKQVAPRIWAGFGGHAFQTSATAATANTGVHKDDYPTADHAVGKDAEKRWGFQLARNKLKAEVREKTDGGRLLRRDGQGYIEYEGMQAGHLEARKRTASTLREVLARK
jgi:putative FmdB family regulatory protein